MESPKAARIHFVGSSNGRINGFDPFDGWFKSTPDNNWRLCFFDPESIYYRFGSVNPNSFSLMGVFLCANKDCQREVQRTSNNRYAKFCSRSCSTHHNNLQRGPMAQITKEKLRLSVGRTVRKKLHKAPEKLADVSSRTISRILSRMGIGCSNCGWNKSTCDIHHIKGRKIKDPHNHDNLAVLCPNCHRLAHTGMIPVESLIPLSRYIGEGWRDHYYGG